MARGLIKIKDKYLEWSTMVAAPVTYGMTLDQLRDWIKEEYGRAGLEELPRDLENVERQGTAFQINLPLEELISNNRAGDGETELTLDQIYEKYCRKELSLVPSAVQNEILSLYKHLTHDERVKTLGLLQDELSSAAKPEKKG